MISIILFLLLVAGLHAQLEIQIEGSRAGWAHRLPCWRVDNKWTKMLLGKELTGYHFYLIVLFLVMFHGIFLFKTWSISSELSVLGWFCWYWVVEDIFWFIENPNYGLRSFRKGRIFWHKRWFLKLPVSYWYGIVSGTILIAVGSIK